MRLSWVPVLGLVLTHWGVFVTGRAVGVRSALREIKNLRLAMAEWMSSKEPKTNEADQANTAV